MYLAKFYLYSITRNLACMETEKNPQFIKDPPIQRTILKTVSLLSSDHTSYSETGWTCPNLPFLSEKIAFV